MTGTDVEGPNPLDGMDVSRLDSEGALDDVLATSGQWRGAAEIDVETALEPGVQSVLVVGMGGSGIAGDVAAAVGAATLDVPVLVHKGYGVPGWVSERTLVIAASHSGGTEETLDALTAAHGRGARLAAVTSGGAVAELVEGRGPIARIPATGQPRHNVGWLAGGALRLLGLDEGLAGAAEAVEAITAGCGPRVDTDANPAKRVASRVAEGGTTLIWGAPGIGGVAGYRLACQLNENAELPAWPLSLPELDHNAVVGWQHPESAAGLGGLVVVRDTDEHPRMSLRVTATLPLVRENVRWVVELGAQGEHPLARLASLLVKADLVSIYTALALGRDPTPIHAIKKLKAEMAAEGEE
jgi:glucose/mannose-6-phosphate isomerase